MTKRTMKRIINKLVEEYFEGKNMNVEITDLKDADFWTDAEGISLRLSNGEEFIITIEKRG